MTLSELIAEVYLITNRPDLTSQTSSAVRAATLKIHQSDYYYKDLYETGIVFSSSEYEQSIDYRLLIPRWRALKYLRKSDSAGIDTLPFFTVIDPASALDEFNQNRTDVCYVAGANVQIKSSTAFQYALLGCYINPNITATGFDSWVALDHPFSIVYEAAAQIFKQTGDTEQFAAFTQLAREQLAEVRMTNIQAQGY